MGWPGLHKDCNAMQKEGNSEKLLLFILELASKHLI
jgi:hypothetical protein